MDQVRSELALANAQELINVSIVGRKGLVLAQVELTCCILENQRKVLLEVCPQAWCSSRIW